MDAVVYRSRAEPFHASVSEMPAARALSRAAPVPQPALGFGSFVLDRQQSTVLNSNETVERAVLQAEISLELCWTHLRG